MRAYRSCASARCGCRSSPVSATRCAASNWPFWRSSSPSRRNTRLSGSWASWEESVLISSAMQPRSRAAEGLGRRLRAAHVVELRQLDLRSEEHTSELQSRPHLVCRLLLEKTEVIAQ